MGLFRRRRSSRPHRRASGTDPVAGESSDSSAIARRTDRAPSSRDSLSPLVSDLRQAVASLPLRRAQDATVRALRRLYAMSEHEDRELDRSRRMALHETLVPTLLHLLQPPHPQQSSLLALLVLNNLARTSHAKAVLLRHHRVPHTLLTRLLRHPDHPAGPWTAIVLVNLSDTPDASLRSLWAQPDSFHHQTDESDAPALSHTWLYALAMVLVQADAIPEDHSNEPPPSWAVPPRLETLRWILVALKNLSRPGSSDEAVAHVLVNAPGLVPLLLRLVLEKPTPPHTRSHDHCPRRPGTSGWSVEGGSDDSPTPANAVQEAARGMLLQLTAMPAARYDLLCQTHTVAVLSTLCQSQQGLLEDEDEEERVWKRLQAKMALAYLLCSSGQFGQLPAPHEVTVQLAEARSQLILSQAETRKLVSVLAKALHRRTDPGPSGSSADAGTVKDILLAVRCLLTQYENQSMVAKTASMALNALLVKALAQHALGTTVDIDAEAAEHACFSLYLLSNHCFVNSKSSSPFLTRSWAQESTEMIHPDLLPVGDWRVVKILTAYLQLPSVTPAGKHAAEQLVKRIRYLSFGDLASEWTRSKAFVASDYELDSGLCEVVDMMMVPNEVIARGVRPYVHITDRPVLRRCALGACRSDGPWDPGTDRFPSALLAAQDVSYGSSKVGHLDAIDDVLIANNIAHAAMGNKTESYNCLWSWEDKAEEIQRQLTRQGSMPLALVTSTTPCQAMSDVGLWPSLGFWDKLLGLGGLDP